MINLACRVLSSFLSASIFVTTTVELNDIAKPSQTASELENLKAIRIKKHTKATETTWIIPAIADAEKLSLSFLKLISKPTVNNKKAMPISAKPFIIFLSEIKPKTKGPRIIPETTYARIKLCFNLLEM